MNSFAYAAILLLIAVVSFLMTDNKPKKIVCGISALIFLLSIVDQSGFVKSSGELGIFVYMVFIVSLVLGVTQYFKREV